MQTKNFQMSKLGLEKEEKSEVKSEVAQFCPTLCNPMDCSFPKQPKTRFTVFSVFTIKNAQIKAQISLSLKNKLYFYLTALNDISD